MRAPTAAKANPGAPLTLHAPLAVPGLIAGSVTFEPGESIKSLHVEILRCPPISGTTEFGLELTSIVSDERADLGKYLFFTVCKIIDSDTFPSNKFQEQLRGGNMEKIELIEDSKLFWEYCKSRLSMRTPFRATSFRSN